MDAILIDPELKLIKKVDYSGDMDKNECVYDYSANDFCEELFNKSMEANGVKT